jgi:predicted transposase/invertase (TIGR01784 family)
MIPGLDPTVDYAFKKVFGSESNVPILLDLLDAVLQPPPDQRLVALDIRNPFNDKDVVDDKLSILDIKARDERGRQYNVEMQMVGPRLYPQRVLYYWAVLHSQQLREGADYRALQATISINFVNSVLFPQVPDHHLDFQLRSPRHPELIFCPQQSIHVVELPKFQKAASELADPLDVWCYFLIHGANLDTDNLPAALRTPPVRRAMEVLAMMTQSELERERYEARLKFQRDQYSYVRDAREEGLEKGEIMGRIHAYQSVMKLANTPRDELLALAVEELRAKAEALEKQLATLTLRKDEA